MAPKSELGDAYYRGEAMAKRFGSSNADHHVWTVRMGSVTNSSSSVWVERSSEDLFAALAQAKRDYEQKLRDRVANQAGRMRR